MFRRFGFFFALISSFLCAGNRPPDDGPWLEVQTPNFRIFTNSNLKSGRNLGWQMEKVRAILAGEYPHYRFDAGRPLVIFAARNNGSFLRLMGADGEQARAFWTDGLAREGLLNNYIICRADKPQRLLKRLSHEYVHMVHRINYAHMPLWLDEGLAEYYERSNIEFGEARMGFLNTSNLVIRMKTLAPLEELFGTDHHSHGYQSLRGASSFYAQSWALVHYLKTDPQAQEGELLDNLLADLWAGKAPLEATLQRLGDPQLHLERLTTYVDRANFPHRSLPIVFEVDKNSFKMRMLPSSESQARLGLYLADVGEVENGIRYLDVAESLAAEPIAALGRSLIGYRKGDWASVLSKADEAILGLGIEAYGAHFLAGSVRQGEKGMEHLKQALAIRSDFAPAMSQMGLRLASSHDAAVKAHAISLARLAISLEQGNVSNQVRLIKVLHKTGNDLAAIKEGGAILAREPQEKVRLMVQKTLYAVAQSQRILLKEAP